ncbi:hypothetical protein NQ318_007856 [Aromia moschata]|uniref:Uncharacterized protein n=1 Tax=Aromia moschata TaxID=1265417 RepID=A0AAV8XMG2_9CUCU|nr:hypothetical protein NQ318_007856 [Aromia moschata]
MEGYGTDDDTNSEIDLERRKTFIEGKPEIPAEKIEDEEDEDDTQVSSNINIDDSSVNNNIRVPETPCSADGIKNLLQKVSDAENNHKRQAGEEMPHFPRKASRRNSDHSVKSDSSRVSNISDKINRVDISENMEITLGNDDIACVSISENMSSSSSESSKSGSEHSLESKKKPVQVDIENTELTISPSNKLKISDKLMKRLSDTDENVESTQKVNDVKRALMEKSPTDILIEKFKGVVEHEIIDFGQPSTSTACDDEDPEDFRENTEASSTTNLRDKIENLEDNLDPRPPSMKKQIGEIPVNKASEGLAPIEEIIQSVTEATKTMESNKFIDEPQKVICAPRGQSQSTQEKENSNRKEQDAQSQKESQTESVKQQNERNVENTIILEKENSNETQVVSKAIERGQSKEVDPRASKIEKLQPSTKELTSSADKPAFVEKSPNNTPSSTKESAEVSPEKPASNNEEAANEKDSKVANLIEEADEGEEMDTLEDIQIDKDNIFNIIHSSLNGAKAKEDNKDDPADKSSAAFGKKRKLSSDENAPSQTKIVKIVPIESILKMHHKDKNGAESLILQRTLQGKKTVRRPSVSSTGSISIQNSSREIAAEEIKSEPETDEDFSESENLEAKRKYLSALNISEKVNDADKKLKANEIRTRSKTEEKKERFRIVDNMTRTIDDVALNYSASRRASSKKNESVLKEGARGSATPQEGEIYVKSFAKMQMPKQRARKSFPVPAYVKPNNSVVTSQPSLLRKDISPVTVTKKDAPKSTSSGNTNTVAAKIISSVASPATPQTPRPIESVTSSVSHLILLPPNQTINYTTSLITPVINAVPVITPTTTAITTTQIITPTLVKSKPITPNIRASQNYIPQSEDTNRSNELLATNGTLLNDLLNQPIVSTSRTEPEPVAQTESGDSTTPAIEAASDASQDNDFGVLNNLLPESVTHAVSDLLIRPPPKLKPRPPGMLSVSFDEEFPVLREV